MPKFEVIEMAGKRDAIDLFAEESWPKVGRSVCARVVDCGVQSCILPNKQYSCIMLLISSYKISI